jgi:cyclohexa-1,5-dienecarbonyl-CoA hydratase
VSDDPSVRVERLQDGRLVVLALARPRANILDTGMIQALGQAFEAASSDGGVKAIVLAADGPNFSYGASVEEHVRERAPQMIKAFGGLCHALYRSPVPLLAAVQGFCLGGALELVLQTHRIIADPDARLGLPEITLGVFPPVAAAMCAAGLARPGLEISALSGRMVEGEEAVRMGLVDELAPRGQTPLGVAVSYFEANLARSSASSLRRACRALRSRRADAYAHELAAQEMSYLEELMATQDANEGIASFLEKRKPRWRDA